MFRVICINAGLVKVAGNILVPSAGMQRQEPVTKMQVFRTRRALKFSPPLRDDEMIGSE